MPVKVTLVNKLDLAPKPTNILYYKLAADANQEDINEELVAWARSWEKLKEQTGWTPAEAPRVDRPKRDDDVDIWGVRPSPGFKEVPASDIERWGRPPDQELDIAWSRRLENAKAQALQQLPGNLEYKAKINLMYETAKQLLQRESNDSKRRQIIDNFWAQAQKLVDREIQRGAKWLPPRDPNEPGALIDRVARELESVEKSKAFQPIQKTIEKAEQLLPSDSKELQQLQALADQAKVDLWKEKERPDVIQKDFQQKAEPVLEEAARRKQEAAATAQSTTPVKEKKPQQQGISEQKIQRWLEELSPIGIGSMIGAVVFALTGDKANIVPNILMGLIAGGAATYGGWKLYQHLTKEES